MGSGHRVVRTDCGEEAAAIKLRTNFDVQVFSVGARPQVVSHLSFHADVDEYIFGRARISRMALRPW